MEDRAGEFHRLAALVGRFALDAHDRGVFVDAQQPGFFAGGRADREQIQRILGMGVVALFQLGVQRAVLEIQLQQVGEALVRQVSVFDGEGQPAGKAQVAQVDDARPKRQSAARR